MILVTGSFVAEEAQFTQAVAVSRAHCERSRLEPGCMAHAVHQDLDNPLRLVFVEQWTDQAALQGHIATPETRAFLASIRALAAGGPEISIFTVSAVDTTNLSE